MINIPSRIAPLIHLDTDSFYVPFSILGLLLAEGISASHGFRFLEVFKKGEQETGETKV
jgi:hypothetical protein